MKKLLVLLLGIGVLLGFADMSYAELDLNNGLMAYYSFDEFRPNDDLIADESGNLHDLSIYGKVTPINGVKGSAIKFKGDGSLLYSPDAGQPYENYTIAFWYYHKKRNLIDWGSSDDSAELVFHYSGGAAVKLNNESEKITLHWSTPLPDGFIWYSCYTYQDTMKEWTFVVVTFDGEKFTTYKNAKFPLEIRPEQELVPVDNNYVLIGGFTDHNWFYGSVDEVRLYNRVLTEEEIMALYQNP